MSKFDDLERQALAFPPNEKAALARTLIDDLDRASDPDTETLWFEEARRRYEAYRLGDMPSVSGDEAMARARNRLR